MRVVFDSLELAPWLRDEDKLVLRPSLEELTPEPEPPPAESLLDDKPIFCATPDPWPEPVVMPVDMTALASLP